MKLLLDIQYFPSVITYRALSSSSYVIFEQYDNYQKRSFRNRCIIAGANGPIVLSIPLEAGRDQRNLTKDVRIAKGSNWQAQHWKSIISSYNRSPWFESFSDGLHDLYSMPYDFLVDWDLACFEWMMKKLDLPAIVSRTSNYNKSYPESEYHDMRNYVNPRNYKNISTPRYRQVFEDRTGFLPNLSMLDLLFCEGKGAANLLTTPEL